MLTIAPRLKLSKTPSQKVAAPKKKKTLPAVSRKRAENPVKKKGPVKKKAAKRPARAPRKPKDVPPPFLPGEVFANLYHGAEMAPASPAPCLVRCSEKSPPSESLLWYKLCWRKEQPLLISADCDMSYLRVAYKESDESKGDMRDCFQVPIRWSACRIPGDIVSLPNLEKGEDHFWYHPACTIQVSDRAGSAIVAIYFAIINVNFYENWGRPIWVPVINSGAYLEDLFPGRYKSLPPCHPDQDIAIATTDTQNIPQRTPAWCVVRTNGGTYVVGAFDFYGDKGAEILRPNAAMIRGTQGEDHIQAIALAARPTVKMAEVGWMRHPHHPQTRGTSCDALVEDSSITEAVVPRNTIEGAAASGINLEWINWQEGAAELKYSVHDRKMRASYFPQMINHMTCSRRMYCDLKKYCESMDTLYIWRIWRDFEIEAKMEAIMADPRIAAKAFNHEVATSEAAQSLMAHWEREADRLNEAGADWVIPGAVAIRQTSALKRTKALQYTQQHVPVLRHMKGENERDVCLSTLWLNAVDMGAVSRAVTEIQKYGETHLYPYPQSVYTGSAQQREQLITVATAQRRAADMLTHAADYITQYLS